jgi:starch synthase (maltosyl-transferring)
MAPKKKKDTSALDDALCRRVVIDNVQPSVDGGLFPVKRCVGDRIEVIADLLIDGHDHIDGELIYRFGAVGAWRSAPLESLGNDQYRASFAVDAIGRWSFAIEAWVNRWSTQLWGLARKFEAGQDVHVELLDLANLLRATADRAAAKDPSAHTYLVAAATDLAADTSQAQRVAKAQDAQLGPLMRQFADRSRSTKLERPLEVIVDPVVGRCSTWYELFPRSLGKDGKHGTLRDVQEHLPYLVEMGFDVLYLPPIHPIGRTFRKGPNNSLSASPLDVGCPWAIGAKEGGHKAIHPELGTIEDFRALVAKANELGIQVALDIAFQTSPDHLYVQEHPEWFVHKADGSIQYAENPPKKYQDVYPFNFESSDWQALWEELASVFYYWADQGVRIFRVDNPHTKPFAFWQWCLAEVKAKYPDAVFLAEAFTRPRLMAGLGKLGFTQSYTYFTWRTTKAELTTYLSEITAPAHANFFRPNLWPNTPDILPEHLQHGNRATFIARLVLAATLSSNYGIYGPSYELMERVPREGVEEYVDNEKYQLRTWNLDHPDSLRHVIARLNRVRKDEEALQHNVDLTFHRIDNDHLIAYSKRSPDRHSTVLTIVNLDPIHTQTGWLELDLEKIDVGSDESFDVYDAMTGSRFEWRGAKSFIILNPNEMPAHVLLVQRRTNG